MNITVAKSWSELNSWQLGEIAHLYLSADLDAFAEDYQKIIFILFQGEKKKHARLRKIMRSAPISALEPFARFLLHETNYYSFPIVPGLLSPGDRLSEITISQFSIIDTLFHRYNNEKSDINLKRLVASLYRLHNGFHSSNLSQVASVTDQLPVRSRESIALAYMFTRIYITKCFPIVFPKIVDQQEDVLKPIFSKEKKFVPFEKIIIAMSMDELQPLGKKQDVNNVGVYEFMSVLSESIIYHNQKSKNNERK